MVFDNWKVIRYIEEDRYEVYDLSLDVAEGNDLSAQRPDIVARGRKIMEREHSFNKYYPLFPSEGYKPSVIKDKPLPANWEIEALRQMPMSAIRALNNNRK